MNSCEQYLISFGQLTKEQEKIVKTTLVYQACLVGDTIKELGRVIITSLKLRRNKC